MKKLLSILLAITITAGAFTACSTKPNEATSIAGPELAEADILEKSTAHAQMMLDGKFDEITKDMTEKVKGSLTSAQLKSAWDQTVASLGKYQNSTMQSSSENGKSKEITVVNSLEYETKVLQLSITYTKDGQISGLWLKPVEKTSDLEDSATYRQENIQVGEHKLTGILTIPKNVENPPVVVMLQGSGSSDFDGTISANKPFKDIANALAEQGIATVRYNKRYFQHGELATAKVTVKDEYLEDISAAIAIAKEKVGDKIYVLGHSLGGMSAPKIAKDNKDVKGIISLAGSPRGLEDIMYSQNEAVVAAMDMTQEQKDATLADVKAQVAAVKALTKDDGSAPLTVAASYWLSLRELDTLNISKQLTIPMLILQGSADFQMNVKDDFEFWKKELAGKENATFKLYDNLNHLFMQSTYKGEMNMAEYDLPGTVEKQVTDDIAQWINKNVG